MPLNETNITLSVAKSSLLATSTSVGLMSVLGINEGTLFVALIGLV